MLPSHVFPEEFVQNISIVSASETARFPAKPSSSWISLWNIFKENPFLFYIFIKKNVAAFVY